MDTLNSLQYRWDHKKISDLKVVDEMESLDNWEARPLYAKDPSASISLSTEQVFKGKTSIKFISPTKLPFRLKAGDRYWDWQFLTRKFNREDFSKYNRISVQIYPEFRGHRKPYLMLVLHNEGNVPDKYFRDGVHTFMLKNHQWNEVVMEIPHLLRNQVTGVSLVYRLQGNEADAADTIAYYADQLAFETVEPDHYKGWHTGSAIAFSHTGYHPDAAKTAFTSQTGTGKFRVVNVQTNQTILEKNVQRQTSRIGTFTVFDFSAVKAEGVYKIDCNGAATKPFPIKKEAWLPTLEKSLNLFLGERCGYELPGIHLACHRDWYTLFKGDTIRLSGGWHDAGDLSQSYTNTADATGILFKLARKYQKQNPRLAKRLIDEGLWGLTWLHNNRFEGGKCVAWAEIDRYTDGKTGTLDDVIAPEPAGSSGLEAFYSVIANVNAAIVLASIHPEQSAKSKAYALEDWQHGTEHTLNWDTDHLAMALSAGAELYQLTGNEGIKRQLIAYADQLLPLQQKEPKNWTIPLKGFFFKNGDKNRVFGYNHGFTVASPIDGLVTLCKLFPGHPRYQAWYVSIRLYANYLKSIAGLTAPYYMVPANIYKLGYADDDVTAAEGDAQAKKGIKLDDEHYLRMFPVWGMFRGNNPNVLSRGIGLASAYGVLKDPKLRDLAQAQLEWVVGKNPFGQSQMYGEGYNFSPQYAVMTGDIVGGIPVGILTSGDADEPYCQASIFCNYKEVWGHCSIRFMELLYNLDL